MPSTMDVWRNPAKWWSLRKFCRETGVHFNTLTKAKQQGKIPSSDILTEFGSEHWWINKDTKWRPRGHGRPRESNECLRRRSYYIRYIPECPDLRTLKGNPTQKAHWMGLIRKLVEVGPEKFLELRDGQRELID
jgi:hypothetical protein